MLACLLLVLYSSTAKISLPEICGFWGVRAGAKMRGAPGTTAFGPKTPVFFTPVLYTCVKPKKRNKCIFHPWVCGFSCVLAVHRTHCRLAHRVATGNARTFSCAGVFDAVYRCFVPATRCACLLLVQPSLRTLGISKPTVEFSNSAHRCGTVCFARKHILPAK